MALRVTRQHTEILAQGGGDVRVTRQYIEVLAERLNVIEKTASNTLNLTQNIVRAPTDFARSASNTINLSQAIYPGQTFHKDAENEMNLASILNRVLEANASNTMNLVQHIIELHIPNDFIPLTTTLNFVQQVDWEAGLYKHVTQTFTLIQQLDVRRPYYFYINHYLTSLNQEVSGYHGCPWLPVEFEDNLNLASVLNRTYTIEANNVIVLTHSTYRKQTPETTLNLVQSLEWGKAKGIPPTELELEQTVNVCGVFQRTLEHTNIIGHALTYYTDKACDDKQYTPFIGENTISNAPTPPSTFEPIVQNDSTITRFKLAYPALAVPIAEIELRAPELDNIDRIAFSRVNRETRGGKLTVFADPNWPQVQTVIVTFIGLTKTEVDDLLDFFTSYVGEEISMQDWEGREWIGIITTPNEAAVQDGKQSWTITFEFEGVLVDGYTPGDRLNLVDTLSREIVYHRSIVHDVNLVHSATYILV